MKDNFIEILKSNDIEAEQAIKNLFIKHKITKLDVSNKDDEYDNVYAYCFNDECDCAENVMINTICFEDERHLSFIDENNCVHSSIDFHDGTLPYIYHAVSVRLKHKNQKTFNVSISYNGTITTRVSAGDEETAIKIARKKIEELIDFDLYAMELHESDIEVEKTL